MRKRYAVAVLKDDSNHELLLVCKEIDSYTYWFYKREKAEELMTLMQKECPHAKYMIVEAY